MKMKIITIARKNTAGLATATRIFDFPPIIPMKYGIIVVPTPPLPINKAKSIIIFLKLNRNVSDPHNNATKSH